MPAAGAFLTYNISLICKDDVRVSNALLNAIDLRCNKHSDFRYNSIVNK